MIVPPLFLPAFALGIIVSCYLPERGGALLWAAVFAVLSVLAAAGYVRSGKGSLKAGNALFQAAFCLLAAAAGAGYGIWRTEAALVRQWPVELYPQAVELTVRVDGLPERSESGRVRFTGEAQTADGRRYRLLFQDYAGREWQTGERWHFRSRVRAPLGTRNPTGFDREGWALANGIDGIASVGKDRFRLPDGGGWGSLNRYRALISESWRRSAPQYPQGAGLMRALAVGDGSGLDYRVWAAMRPLGIQHLISISGLHIGMVALMAGWLAKQLMRLMPSPPRRPRLWQLSCGVAAAAVYTGLAGWDVPALRSLVMLVVFAAAWVRRGRAGSWQVWWAALAAVLLWQPAAVLSAGFWLSFGLVAALLWALSFRLPDADAAGIGGSLKTAVAGQWSATLTGWLGTAFLFGQLPPFSLLVNAVAIPFFSWLLTPLALAASVLPFDFLRTAAAWLGEQTVGVLLWLGFRLPDIPMPHAPALLFWTALAGALVWLLPRGLRLRPLALVSLAAFLLYRPAPPAQGSLNVQVLDVGQGLAVLFRTPSHTILFDTGTPAAEAALMPALRAAGVRHLDALVLSHHDNDHDGGYPALSQSVTADVLWAGQPEFYPNARYCAEGITWQADGTVFEFLTPPPESDESDDNERSCVLRVVHGSQAVLLTGDLGKKGEERLVGRYGGDLYSQILILGHHGSRHSSGNRFISAVSPEVAVASSGFANPFKHPHPQVVNILNANRVKLMRTDTQGGLSFTLSENGFQAARTADAYRKWWQRKPFDVPQKKPPDSGSLKRQAA